MSSTGLGRRLARLEAMQAAGSAAPPVVDAATLEELAGAGIAVDPALLGATQAELLAALSDADLELLERLLTEESA